MRQCPHESSDMVYVFGTAEILKCLSIASGGWGGGGYETRNCLLSSMVCVCVCV